MSKTPCRTYTNRSLMLLSAETIKGFATAVKSAAFHNGQWDDEHSKAIYLRWKNTAAELKKRAPKD